MIQVRLKDGTMFAAQIAEWSIVLPEGRVVTFDEIEALMVLPSDILVGDGNLNLPTNVEPIKTRALQFIQEPGPDFEVPIPLEDAEALGDRIKFGRIEIADTMPSRVILRPNGGS